MVARKDFTGGAVVARLNADITSSSTTIVLAATPGATGWPTGANGEFGVVIDPGLAAEEKMLVLSRAGTSLTLASAGKRGQDGTSAAAHTAGAVVEHCFFAADADAANEHVSNSLADPHTQYILKSLYDANTVLAATSDDTPAALTMGASTILARLAAGNIVAATPAQLRTLLALVIGTNVQAWDADLDALAALTSAANKMPYATGAQAWALADLTAAGRALIDDADASAQLSTLGVSTFIKTLLDDADQATAQATLGVLGSGAWAAYTPTDTNITVGNGTRVARYATNGKIVSFRWSLVFGSTSSIGGAADVGLPTAASASGYQAVSANFYDASTAATRVGGAAEIAPSGTAALPFGPAGQLNASAPFTWTTSDRLVVSGSYEIP